MIRLAACLLAAALSLAAQINSIQFTAAPPPTVSNIRAQVVGVGGQTTYCYWVTARYPVGVSLLAGPARVVLAANTLGGGNFVTIQWNPASGATGYDVIRRTAPQFPVAGTCVNCVVASNTAATSFNDIGGAVVNWPTGGTVVAQQARASIVLNNRDAAVPYLEVVGASLDIGAFTANSFTYAGAGGLLASTAAATDGQLLIGDTGAVPVRAALTGTANRVTVTDGAGTITLSGPQDIAAGSSPVFAGLTVSGLTPNAFIYPGAAGILTSTAAATDGQLLIGDTGAVPVLATLTGTANQVVVTPAAGAITLSAPQDIAAGSSPVFAGLTVSALTPNAFIYPGAAGILASTAAAADGQLLIGDTGAIPVLANLTGTANRVTVTNGAGTITLSGPQDLAATSTPAFTGLALENAAVLGTESLTAPADFSQVQWAVAAEFAVVGTLARYTFAATGNGTVTQTAGGNLAIDGIGSQRYRLDYTISAAPTVVGAVMTLTNAFALAAVPMPIVAGANTVYFESAAAPANFVINVTGATAGTFTIEQASLRQIQGGNLVARGPVRPVGVTLADLPAAAPNGTILYCADCDPAIAGAGPVVCASAGAATGSMAFRVNGAWTCLGI